MISRETWKFMAMAVITVNLKQIFRHIDATLPKYLIRWVTIMRQSPSRQCPRSALISCLS